MCLVSFFTLSVLKYPYTYSAMSQKSSMPASVQRSIYFYTYWAINTRWALRSLGSGGKLSAFYCNGQSVNISSIMAVKHIKIMHNDRILTEIQVNEGDAVYRNTELKTQNKLDIKMESIKAPKAKTSCTPPPCGCLQYTLVFILACQFLRDGATSSRRYHFRLMHLAFYDK